MGRVLQAKGLGCQGKESACGIFYQQKMKRVLLAHIPLISCSKMDLLATGRTVDKACQG